VNIAVPENAISITQSVRERVGDIGALAEIAMAARDQDGRALPVMPGVCPHCGSVLAAARVSSEVGHEPFGA
jgi:predicted Zn-ribbon and HTH transcriptional regulator